MNRWTRKRPTEPGFYWVREQNLPDTIVSVQRDSSGLLVWNFGNECETELSAYGDDTTRWRRVEK